MKYLELSTKYLHCLHFVLFVSPLVREQDPLQRTGYLHKPEMFRTGSSSWSRAPAKARAQSRPELAATVCLSLYVKQWLSCSARRLQNGLCVLTSRVAQDHTLSKHCHATGHVGAVGQAGCREQGSGAGASRQLSGCRSQSSAPVPKSPLGLRERGCGGRGGPGRG